MTTALFVTFSAGGNLPPALGIAQRLLSEGDRAVVLGDETQRASVERAGVTFEAFSQRQPFRPVERACVLRGVARLDRTVASCSIAADLDRVAGAIGADVVVVDCMLLGPLAASVRSGRPTITLVHSFPSFFAGPYAGGPVGLLARRRGLAPARVWGSAAATLATALPALDPAAADGPWAGLRLVGPVTPVIVAPVGDAAAAHARRSWPRPRVLISLSTVWYPGQDRTLQRLLDAVAPLDLDAVMTTGPSCDPARFRAPSNVELHRYVDHDEVLPSVDLVVGHGGHGTAMRALAHDRPLLIIPGFSMTDQPTVGRRIAQAGAGQTLRKSASARQLRAAIETLAADGPHRAAAAGLGAQLRALDPAGDAVALVRAQAGVRATARS